MDQTIRIVVPVGSPAASASAGGAGGGVGAGPRSAWLLHNGKTHGDVVLGALGRGLESRGWTVTAASKGMPSSPCPDDLFAAGVTHAGALTALSD
jgi:hypothetical protein